MTLFRAELELLPVVGGIKHTNGNQRGLNHSPNLPRLLRLDFTLGLLLVGLVGTLAKLFGSSDENDSDAGSSSTAKEGTVLFTTTRFLPRNLDLCCCLTPLGGLARKLEPC